MKTGTLLIVNGGAGDRGLNAIGLNAKGLQKGLYRGHQENFAAGQASQDNNEKSVLTIQEQKDLEKPPPRASG